MNWLLKATVTVALALAILVGVACECSQAQTGGMAQAGGKPKVDPREAAYQKCMMQAQAAMKAKRYADAVKAYDEALKIKPGDSAAIKGKKAAAAAAKK
jgi:hypothetical protein